MIYLSLNSKNPLNYVCYQRFVFLFFGVLWCTQFWEAMDPENHLVFFLDDFKYAFAFLYTLILTWLAGKWTFLLMYFLSGSIWIFHWHTVLVFIKGKCNRNTRANALSGNEHHHFWNILYPWVNNGVLASGIFCSQQGLTWFHQWSFHLRQINNS